MNQDDDSKQQELPAWRSEEPTMAGPSSHNGRASYESKSVKATKGNEGCCSKIMDKCGPIGWYFSPLLGGFGYSVKVTFYHIAAFALTLAAFIIAVTLLSVSVGLLILVFGFILFWWTCEISVVMARLDLALAYYMVENDGLILANGGETLKLSSYKRLTPCPCSHESRNHGGTCCNRTMARMKSIACQCNMVKIFLHQIFVKPLIVSLTWWISIVNIYVIACIFAPVVYIVASKVFTKHYWCPFGDESCDGDCECNIVSIENFGDALLFGLCAFLVAPLVLRISNLFGKLSKATSYWMLTNHYGGDNDDFERNNLLTKSSDNNNNNNTPQIVHSVNNPYVNDV